MHPGPGDFARAGARRTTRPVPEVAPLSVPLALRVLDEGREVVIERELAVGRDPENDLVLPDPGVSARHFLLVPARRAVYLRDCQSRNGTFVGGLRVEAAELAPGADIMVGSTRLRAVRVADRPAAAPFIGRSRALRQALARLERAAPTRLSILLLGESGTGKELAARAVHERSRRAAGPFVAVNCSAIPREVAESELFGHERGAFTGAQAARAGVFEEADGGTLFLDEVGDLDPRLQPKLLRALETGRVRRVGGRGEVAVDVRVVAATNCALAPARFRSDLYHRLAAIPVTLPPLRERPEDIALLVEHFLDQAAREHGPRQLAEDALAALERYPWPGNVRELKHAIERGVVLAGPVLGAADLLPAQPATDDAAPGHGTLAEMERAAIAAALARTGGNRRQAARLLGLPRTTLCDRARRLGLLCD
jgi:DNA-binding NtrC family response regulator